MPETPEPPLLNPVLTLQMDPRPEPRPGRGKDASKIVASRLRQQQEVLAGACQHIVRQRAHYPTFAGKVHLIASMFEDSFTPGHTPRDLFNEDVGCRFVAPFTRGYLIEATIDRLPLLVRKIGEPTNTASRVDISRVEKLGAFDQNTVLRGRKVEQLWDKAPELDDGRLFSVWFTPFRDGQARRALLETIDRLSSEHTCSYQCIQSCVCPGLRIVTLCPSNSYQSKLQIKPVSLVLSAPIATQVLHVPLSSFRSKAHWHSSLHPALRIGLIQSSRSVFLLPARGLNLAPLRQMLPVNLSSQLLTAV